jgi:hypothetical protein
METHSSLLSRLFLAAEQEDAALQTQLYREIDEWAPWLKFPEVLQTILRRAEQWSSEVERVRQLDQLEAELRTHFLRYVVTQAPSLEKAA